MTVYKVGYPLWRCLAWLGVPLWIRVDVLFDSEANVYVATSPDLQGLVAEAKTAQELIAAVCDCVEMLVQEQVRRPLKHKPLAAWNGQLQQA